MPELQTPAASGIPDRDRWLLWGCVAAVTALAWLYLFHLDRQMSAAMTDDRMMAEMGMREPWRAADVALTCVMWTVMMIGMMAPSAAPVLLLFAAAARKRTSGSSSARIAAFAGGYAVVWTTFSVVASLAQWGLHDAALLSSSMATSSHRLAGLILIGAGVYQLTPAKVACLTHCRSPLGFLMSHWREGATGAFTMGVRHGVYCLGCCWALMCVLFVVGIMNLLWIAALAAVVFIEKTGPRGLVVARLAGLSAAVAGVFLLVYGPA